MNNPMTNRSTGVSTARGLLLVVVLLLSACDGGIFGTGGPDMSASTTADIIPLNESGMDTNSDTASIGSTDTSAGGSAEPENGVASSVDGASSTDGVGDSDGGGTDSGADDGGASPGNGDDIGDGTTGSGDETDNETLSTTIDIGTFINNQASLNSTAAQVNVINATSLSINVVETGASAQPVLFGATGIAMNTLSNRATLLENETSLDIIDNNARSEKIFSFSNFAADDSTFSTLLVRANGAQFDAVPLISLTTTQDATLAKVRVIQAIPFNDAAAEAMFSLQSAGTNPGGVDVEFGPLSFVSPETNYSDIPNGDYELIDSLGRVQNQMLSFTGGNVYTVVLLDNSTRSILVINDTEAATQ